MTPNKSCSIDEHTVFAWDLVEPEDIKHTDTLESYYWHAVDP